MKNLTEAQKATFDHYELPYPESVESCHKCDGYGEIHPDHQCISCIGTGIKGFEDLESRMILFSGYAGINEVGKVVDRREYPKAIIVYQNQMEGIPAPKGIKQCSCGVPLDLHNTCCGWQNANLPIDKNQIIIDSRHPGYGMNHNDWRLSGYQPKPATL